MLWQNSWSITRQANEKLASISLMALKNYISVSIFFAFRSWFQVTLCKVNRLILFWFLEVSGKTGFCNPYIMSFSLLFSSTLAGAQINGITFRKQEHFSISNINGMQNIRIAVFFTVGLWAGQIHIPFPSSWTIRSDNQRWVVHTPRDESWVAFFNLCYKLDLHGQPLKRSILLYGVDISHCKTNLRQV